MLFRQLFENNSSTYTYLVACADTGQSVLIDPVLESVDRDLEVLRELGLKLTFTLETHIHADHLTGARRLQSVTGCKIAGPAIDNLPCRDVGVREGEVFRIGNLNLHPLFTPGHTATHHAFMIDTNAHKIVFSGDALLIEACGRTDFQEGDAATLYDSIHNKIFTLPDDTLVYPSHDYSGRALSSVGQEKRRNPRLGGNRSKSDFIRIMTELDLPSPAMMAYAVPGNEHCGQLTGELPADLERKKRDQG